MNVFFQVFSRVTIKNDTGLMLVILLLLFLCIGIIVYVFWYGFLWSKAKNWICVKGHIIEFQESRDWHGSEAPKIKISYEYLINERKFKGSKYHLGWHRDRPCIAIVKSLRTIYAADKVIQVFVDSENNSRSTLNVNFDVEGIVFLVCMFLLEILSIIIFFNLP